MRPGPPSRFSSCRLSDAHFLNGFSLSFSVDVVRGLGRLFSRQPMSCPNFFSVVCGSRQLAVFLHLVTWLSLSSFPFPASPHRKRFCSPRLLSAPVRCLSNTPLFFRAYPLPTSLFLFRLKPFNLSPLRSSFQSCLHGVQEPFLAP